MLNAKSDKSLSRLIAYEVGFLIFSIIFIPVLFYMFNRIKMEFVRTVLIGAFVIMLISVVWYAIKVLVLLKIDFTKTLKNNLIYIGKYAVYIKYEKLIGYYFLTPLIIIICTFHYLTMHASLYWWVLMSCSLIAVIIFSIYLYRLYSKNISTIQQNLEELREL